MKIPDAISLKKDVVVKYALTMAILARLVLSSLNYKDISYETRSFAIRPFIFRLGPIISELGQNSWIVHVCLERTGADFVSSVGKESLKVVCCFLRKCYLGNIIFTLCYLT